MKRKIVQHGPSTLTLSLPAQWVKEQDLHKGDELQLQQFNEGLFLSTDKSVSLGLKHLNAADAANIIERVFAAMYKAGYDEIDISYETPQQLRDIQKTLSAGCIGMEIVQEGKGRMMVKSVSEPTKGDFKTMFRRIFYFIISVAKDSLEAARTHDKVTYEELVLRDVTINKLTDFCRRIINKKGQNDYSPDTCVYLIVEQLEKIGDYYKKINLELQKCNAPLSTSTLDAYEKANCILEQYDTLFFNFNLSKMEQFILESEQYSCSEDNPQISHLLKEIVGTLYDLNGPTMVLHL